MSSIENLYERKYIATQPFDPEDPYHFSQLSEIAKSAFLVEINQFFNYKTADKRNKIREIPTIQKFALGAGVGENSLETVIDSILSYADTPDRFPMIAITSNTSRERKLGIGSNFVAHVQYPPRVEGTKTGPFNLEEDWIIELVTRPRGTPESAVASTILFKPILFPDIHNVDIDQLVNAINAQALYYKAVKTSDGRLRLQTGGPCAPDTPNYIEITGGTLQCLQALGLVVGQSDNYTNSSNPPKNRYSIAADMTMNIDVVADSMPVRTEISDLIYNFFTFYIEKRRFQFFGRSYLEEGLDPEEWYHIIINNQFSYSGELNTPRQGGEQYDYIYAERGSINITIIDYLDRQIVAEPVFLQRENIIPTSELPSGDYGGDDFLKNG